MDYQTSKWWIKLGEILILFMNLSVLRVLWIYFCFFLNLDFCKDDIFIRIREEKQDRTLLTDKKTGAKPWVLYFHLKHRTDETEILWLRWKWLYLIVWNDDIGIVETENNINIFLQIWTSCFMINLYCRISQSFWKHWNLNHLLI